APEVPEPPGPPALAGQGEELLAEPVLLPRQDAGVAEDGVRQLRDPGHPHAAAVDERPFAPGRPPPPVQGRRQHPPDLEPAVALQGDEGRPDREAAQVVLGAVDGVEDPAGAPGLVGPALLPAPTAPAAP